MQQLRCYIHAKTAKQKKCAALKSLGEKSCEIKGGGQEMVTKMFNPCNLGKNRAIDFVQSKNQEFYQYHANCWEELVEDCCKGGESIGTSPTNGKKNIIKD